MAQKSNRAAAKMQMGWVYITVGLLVVIAILAWISWQKANTITTCQPQQLQLTAGQQNGAAGTIYQHMSFKNIGNQACAIGGFPTAFLYGTDGYALGRAAAANSNPAPMALTINPGESAYTVLGYPQAGNFPPGNCSGAKSTALKLYVPGASTALETPLEVAWCPGFSSTAMQAGS
jgi:hypothetical protein